MTIIDKLQSIHQSLIGHDLNDLAVEVQNVIDEAKKQEPVAVVSQIQVGMSLNGVKNGTTYQAIEVNEAIKTGTHLFTHPQLSTKINNQEPFGYFKAEPFGWTDCAETDEGAVALYEHPQLSDETFKEWKSLSDVQWMNIVNYGNAWNGWSKEEAVHEAVKMVEAKCKENNVQK